MSPRWGVAQFGQALLTKAVVIAFLVIDAISYAILGRQIPAYVYLVVLIVGLLVASFQVYADLNRRLDLLNARLEAVEGGPSRVVLTTVSAKFGGHGWQNRMPAPPLRFLATLDIRNLSGQQATLREIRIFSISLSSMLIADQPTRISLYPGGSPRRGSSGPFPQVLEPHHWNPRAICEIQVELLEKDPQEFAKRLHELDSFTVILDYSYELLSGPPITEQLTVSGSFAEFREVVLEHWKQSNDEQLLHLALREHSKD